MTLEEIKAALAAGKRVHWKSSAYDVVCDAIGRHLIVCNLNGHAIGLTWRDGVTMNGNPEDFYAE